MTDQPRKLVDVSKLVIGEITHCTGADCDLPDHPAAECPGDTCPLSRAYKIRKLEEEIAVLKATEKAEKMAKAESVQPVYTFTLTPKDSHYDRIYDPTCHWYYLEGHLQNRDELEAVGKTREMSGGMAYLWNAVSGRIILRSGGGTLWITSDSGRMEDDETVLAQLSAFLQKSPSGGDVTDIIQAHRESRTR